MREFVAVTIAAGIGLWGMFEFFEWRARMVRSITGEPPDPKEDATRW
jgi:hypothetical protein